MEAHHSVRCLRSASMPVGSSAHMRPRRSYYLKRHDFRSGRMNLLRAYMRDSHYWMRHDTDQMIQNSLGRSAATLLRPTKRTLGTECSVRLRTWGSKEIAMAPGKYVMLAKKFNQSLATSSRARCENSVLPLIDCGSMFRTKI